jgi:hypothetical protein
MIKASKAKTGWCLTRKWWEIIISVIVIRTRHIKGIEISERSACPTTEMWSEIVGRGAPPHNNVNRNAQEKEESIREILQTAEKDPDSRIKNSLRDENFF